MANRSFLIAEAGVNHNGSLELARQLVEVAKSAGADAVKFQTFDAASLATADAAKAQYQADLTDPGQSQRDMLSQLELTRGEFAEIKMFCDEIDIEFMSTPFDEASAEFLNELGMRRFKIPSGEVTNIRLIRRLAGFGKPIVLSTGMSNLEEIGTALGWIRDVDPQLKPWLMQCVSAYPAPIDELNLLAMDSMSRQFNLPVGFSDHSLGISAALAAAALGAVAIEKHFTLNRNMEGPDHKASLEPAELRQMIQGIREVESALGDGAKTVMPAEREVAFVARRSIVAARDLPAGAVLADSDLLFKRPGTGISAGQVESLIGRVLKKAIVADTLLDWSMIE